MEKKENVEKVVIDKSVELYERKITQSAEFILSKTKLRPKICIILGTGLDGLATLLENSTKMTYKEIPHFPAPTFHKGILHIGKIEGHEIFIMQGRFHFYEGYKMEEIVFPIRVMKKMGVEVLVVTNASGVINKTFNPGHIMIMKDHINMFGTNPLIGPNLDSFGDRFPDMSYAYNSELRDIFKSVAQEKKKVVYEGVYIGVHGPSYETPSEIKFFGIIGADVVGMSTIPEVITANHMKMKVLGLSVMCNWASGISDHALNNDEVVECGKKSQNDIIDLVRGFLSKLKI